MDVSQRSSHGWVLKPQVFRTTVRTGRRQELEFAGRFVLVVSQCEVEIETGGGISKNRFSEGLTALEGVFFQRTSFFFLCLENLETLLAKSWLEISRMSQSRENVSPIVWPHKNYEEHTTKWNTLKLYNCFLHTFLSTLLENVWTTFLLLPIANTIVHYSCCQNNCPLFLVVFLIEVFVASTTKTTNYRTKSPSPRNNVYIFWIA